MNGQPKSNGSMMMPMMLGLGVCVLAVGMGVFVYANKAPAQTQAPAPTYTPAADLIDTPEAVVFDTTPPPIVKPRPPKKTKTPLRPPTRPIRPVPFRHPSLPKPVQGCKLGPAFVQCCLRVARQRQTDPLCKAEVKKWESTHVPMPGSSCFSTGPNNWEGCCNNRARTNSISPECLTPRGLCKNDKKCCANAKKYGIKDPTCR